MGSSPVQSLFQQPDYPAADFSDCHFLRKTRRMGQEPILRGPCRYARRFPEIEILTITSPRTRQPNFDRDREQEKALLEHSNRDFSICAELQIVNFRLILMRRTCP
jgi:hypothetical protein